MKCRFIILIIMLKGASAFGQESARWGLSTNFVDWMGLLTANASAQVSVSRHITLESQVRWNPWTFNSGAENQMQNRQLVLSLGARWWPWYVYSGWWIDARGQYGRYNFGGILEKETEEGDAVGLVLSAGYSLQLTKWLNLDFGAGLWGGYKKYVCYSCPRCGRKTDEGSKTFIMPDALLVGAMIVF